LAPYTTLFRSGPFAARVGAFAALCLELSAHRDARLGGRRPAAAALGRVVALPIRWNERLGPEMFAIADVVFGEVPGVGGGRLGNGAAVVDDSIEHRREMPDVRRLVRHALGDDDLVRLVDGELDVVGLHESAVTLHDATVGVGEVAL